MEAGNDECLDHTRKLGELLGDLVTALVQRSDSRLGVGEKFSGLRAQVVGVLAGLGLELLGLGARFADQVVRLPLRGGEVGGGALPKDLCAGLSLRLPAADAD